MPSWPSGRGLAILPLVCARAGAFSAPGVLGDPLAFRPCGMINHNQTPLGCHEAVETDCTAMRHLARLCPQSCPFVAPHPELSCVFECASSSSCSKRNSEFAFPNNRTYVCEPCNVVGCRRCSSPDRCLECFDNFWLELGGRVCAYVWEDRAKTGVHAGAAVVTVLLILASFVCIILDYCSCCGKCLPNQVQREDDEILDEEVAPPKRPESSGSAEELRADGLGTPLVEPSDSPSGGRPGETFRTTSGELLTRTASMEFIRNASGDLEDSTLRALKAGNRHRVRCKIKDLEVPSVHFAEAGPASIDQRGGQSTHSHQGNHSASSLSRFRNLPLSIDLKSRFLAGVGLPLFHQWFYFLFLYSAMMCAGTAWVYYGSDLSRVLQTYGLDHARKMMLGRDTMSFCEMRDRKDDIGAAVRAFAHRCAVGYLVLWVLGLIASLMHAARQKQVAADFYLRHPCLAEFVLNVEGFPPEATDEEKIKSVLSETLGTSLEVSVGYDYRKHRNRVHELLEKVLVQQDVKAGTYDSALATSGVHGLEGLGLSEDEKAEILRWFEPGNPDGITNAGSVFVVLPHYYDLQMARCKFDNSDGGGPSRAATPPRSSSSKRTSRPPLLPHSSTPEWLPPIDGGGLKWVGDRGRMSELVIRDVVCEPPDVVWDHLGLETSRLACRYGGGILVIVISFVAMVAVIFVPLAQYSIAYMYQAGSFPTGVMMTVVGTLQMTFNWVICLLHCAVSARVGFARRDREGLLIFKAFAVLCLVGFLFNVTITIFPESSAHGGDPLRFFLQPLDSTRKAIDSIKEVSFQVRASVHLFHVLVPGTLFIGYLVWPLQGFVWPLVSTFTFLRCWHRRSYTSDLTARQAEIAMEPLGLSIGHDYMGHIVQPVCCSLILFFASGVAWQIFGFMAIWSVFMAGFMRYLHLRAVRRCYHTTNRLDTEVLFWWGFPLSMVLAASCFWAARLRGWPLYAVPISWACGNALYAALLAFCIRPLSPPKDQGHAYGRPTYDEVRCRRFYDWHNCNPIKVLLSHCQDDGKNPPITPFQVGKEYLQVNDPSWVARMRKAARPADLHSGDSEAMVGMAQCLRHLNLPEVETLIARPLERILGGTTRQQGALTNASPPRRRTNPSRIDHSARTPEQRNQADRAGTDASASSTGAASRLLGSATSAGVSAGEESPEARREGVAAGAEEDGGSAVVNLWQDASPAKPSGGELPEIPELCEPQAPPAVDFSAVGTVPLLPALAESDDTSPSSRGHGRYL